MKKNILLFTLFFLDIVSIKSFVYSISPNQVVTLRNQYLKNITITNNYNSIPKLKRSVSFDSGINFFFQK